MLDEDVGKIQGICWRDEDPKAVAGLMEALGISTRPDHFAAFFPAEVEAKLARLEREFAGRDENQIGRTRFRVAWSGSRFDLVVIEQTPLR